MQIIKEFDYMDYKTDGTVCCRPSVRGIIIRGSKLAMVYSQKYDYYTFAGGGVDKEESFEKALIREIQEELGLEVIPESIKEYGLIVRKESGTIDDLFIQENYFYICDVTDTVLQQKLENYEKEEIFSLRWVTPEEAIETNLTHSHSERAGVKFSERLMEREAWMLQRLMQEGLFKEGE